MEQNVVNVQYMLWSLGHTAYLTGPGNHINCLEGLFSFRPNGGAEAECKIHLKELFRPACVRQRGWNPVAILLCCVRPMRS